MPYFKASELATITADILRAVGATPEEARIVTDALIESNLEGHDSHGVVRLPEYVKWVEKKHIVNGARLEVEKVEGGGIPGLLVQIGAMETQPEKSRSRSK